MALTRKMLKGMGMTEEQIDTIIEAHTDTVDALKEERDRYKVDAEKLPEIQRELDGLKAKQSEGDPYKEKYEGLKSEFDEYKKGIEADRVKAKKVAAYRDLLKKAGVTERRIDTILKVTPLDEIELDGEGIKDADKVVEAIKAEYPEFISATGTQGAETITPPGNNGGDTFAGMSIAEKMRYANAHPTDQSVIDWLNS